jgi:hypothetical protein
MNHTIEIAHTKRQGDKSSGRLIQGACFLVLFPVALVAALTGWHWKPWPPGPDGYGNVIAESSSMARMLAGIAVSV